MTETRNCTKCKHDFALEDDDFSFYEKMKVPAPKVCPDCRFKMRAVWRNEMTLYSGRKCDLCGKGIVTMYNPNSPYKVYCPECWHSDKWDASSYAMNYDSSLPFFDQYQELLLKVPKKALYITTNTGPNINSDYANTAGGLKNCYMVFNGGALEESLYCKGIYGSTETVDGYFGINNDQCYEIVNVEQSSETFYGQNCVSCVDCFLVQNCSGCTNCFGCVNLRNQSYCWFNEKISKEEYEKRINEVMGSYTGLSECIKKFNEFKLSFPVRENTNIKCVNCIGNYLFESKNLSNCFEVTSGEDSKDCLGAKMFKDCNGVVGYAYKSELLLECASVGYANRVIASAFVDNGQNLEYCFAISSSKDCFGCDGLQKKEFCILNKIYSKEEYKKIREQIITELKSKDEYGLMISPALAPFAYNETIAQDNIPMTKLEANAFGLRWEDDVQMTKGKETLKQNEIPDYIKDVPDSITNEVLRCIQCDRNYKIIPQELLFYRKMNLPIPRKCFYCRHQNRIERRGPYKFWKRNCARCDKEITTNYAPDRPEIVYCESCYQKEVI